MIQRKRGLVDNRNINFTMIENEIIDHEDFTVYEKMTYVVLCRFAKDGECFPSYETIAKRVGCSRQKAINVVKELCKKGLISKEQRKNDEDEYTSNIYYINGLDNNVEGGSTQELLPNQQEIPPSQQRLPEQDIINNTNLKNQLVSQGDKITDEQTDEINQIITNARVDSYESEEMKDTIKQIITDCYIDEVSRKRVRKLKIEHIDRAIANYRIAQEEKEIKNPKLYFKKCLLSAIEESGLKGLF
jgi:DNA-binding Lrp family transcriptional regulator